MSYYLHTDEFVFAREGRVFSGYAAFEDFVGSFMESTPDMEWTRAETKVTILGGDVVHFLDRGTVVTRDTDGVAGPEIPFSYTHIWVKKNGGWKVQIAHAAYVQ
jgi:ketosteroid isomerase-like protein